MGMGGDLDGMEIELPVYDEVGGCGSRILPFHTPLYSSTCVKWHVLYELDGHGFRSYVRVMGTATRLCYARARVQASSALAVIGPGIWVTVAVLNETMLGVTSREHERSHTDRQGCGLPW